MFLIYDVTSRDHMFKGLEFLTVSQPLAKFSGHRHCSSNDTAAKLFYVTLQDYVIKGSEDFMKGNSSLYIFTLPN